MSSLTLPPDARCIGQRISQLNLPGSDVRIVSLRRGSGKVIPVSQDPAVEDGDTLVLSGQVEALALAQQELLSG